MADEKGRGPSTWQYLLSLSSGRIVEEFIVVNAFHVPRALGVYLVGSSKRFPSTLDRIDIGVSDCIARTF